MQCPLPGDLPHAGIEPSSPVAGDFFTAASPEKPIT